MWKVNYGTQNHLLHLSFFGSFDLCHSELVLKLLCYSRYLNGGFAPLQGQGLYAGQEVSRYCTTWKTYSSFSSSFLHKLQAHRFAAVLDGYLKRRNVGLRKPHEQPGVCFRVIAVPLPVCVGTEGIHFTWGIRTCQFVRYANCIHHVPGSYLGYPHSICSYPVSPDKFLISMQTFLHPSPHFDTNTQSQITLAFDKMSDDLLIFSVVDIAPVTDDLN